MLKHNYISSLRAHTIARKLKPFISAADRVIDIGAGTCRVAREVQRVTGTAITPIDMLDYNKTTLVIQLYDGETLPYEDNSFDVALLIFVLHHADNIDKVLKEAQRVSRARIIVMEDTPRGGLEQRAWRKIDYQGNHAKRPEVNIAHGTKTIDQWKDHFHDLGLEVLHTQPFKSLFLTGRLYTHTLFVLSPKD